MKLKSYNHTITACTLGYVVQAIVNNFITLLFVYFANNYSITLSQIATLSAFNFFIQLCMDMAAPYMTKVLGCRGMAILAHFMASIGLILMTILPEHIKPSIAFLISSRTYAVGGGVIEVMVSPMVESCPTPENKKASIMSMLHSFYSWGQLGVIILSSLFFLFFGIGNWKVMAYLWAIIPLVNGFYFMFVPIVPPISPEKGMSLKELFSSSSFRLSMAQWASAYAEKTLGLPKAIGDLALPCFFALLMGVSRVVNSRYSEKLSGKKYMLLCGGLCFIAYTLVAISPNPVVGMIGCGLCGFSVGIMWPGTYSIASKALPQGGLLMFSLLALGGDIGCSFGPAMVGYISNTFNNNLHIGMITGIAASLILIIAVLKSIKEE